MAKVDELNAPSVFAASLEPQSFDTAFLETIQRDLFTIGAELASPDPAKVDKALGGPGIGEPQIACSTHDRRPRSEAAAAQELHSSRRHSQSRGVHLARTCAAVRAIGRRPGA